MMENKSGAAEYAEIKKRTISGVGSLVLRNLLIQPISFFGFVFLSVYLQRWELGIFWAVTEVVGFLGYFSDVGLAAAIIQKKEKPDIKELRATFTVQQVLVISLVLIAFFLTPWLETRFDFQNGRYLYWVLLFGFFTSSLKTIPSILLEKELRFDKISIVDLVEQIVFTGLAVFLAWRGMGVNSWAWAIFFRSISGLVLIYILSPWPIGFNFHFKIVKRLFSFGIPFQANSLLAMLKDRLVNIFLWRILGSEGVGVLGWAQRWAQVPLRFLMDQVVRVSFPAYSKLQSDKDILKKALERSVFLVNIVVFPVLVGIGFLMPKVIIVFEKYHKWSIGIIPLWLYLGSFAWGVVTTPLVNAFNSVGKVRLTLNLMVFWTVLTWLLVPPLAKLLGTTGAALGLFIVSSTSFVAWIMAKKQFGISMTRVLVSPLLATLTMFLVLELSDYLIPDSLPAVIALVIIGAVSYGATTWLIANNEVRWLIKNIKECLKKSSK